MTLYNADALLRQARTQFHIFYEAAPIIDAGLLDALVLAHAGLVIGLNAPRAGVPPELRADLERKTNTAEFIYADLRRCVEESETFLLLAPEDREYLRASLFHVVAPTEPGLGA